MRSAGGTRRRRSRELSRSVDVQRCGDTAGVDDLHTHRAAGAAVIRQSETDTSAIGESNVGHALAAVADVHEWRPIIATDAREQPTSKLVPRVPDAVIDAHEPAVLVRVAHDVSLIIGHLCDAIVVVVLEGEEQTRWRHHP